MKAPEKVSLSFAHLRRFNQQIPHADCSLAWDKPNITLEDQIIGQQDILEPVLSQFACEPTLSQELYKTMREALPGSFNKVHLLVLVDSMQTGTGFLTETIPEITRSYNQLFFSGSDRKKIQAASLEQTRRYIRDHGPIIGLFSKNMLELKLCCAIQLKDGGYAHKEYLNHKKLTRLNAWLKEKGEAVNLNFFPLLEILAHKQLNRNARRDVTPTMTKRLLHCDATSSEILSLAYQRLPITPLGLR